MLAHRAFTTTVDGTQLAAGLPAILKLRSSDVIFNKAEMLGALLGT